MSAVNLTLPPPHTPPCCFLPLSLSLPPSLPPFSSSSLLLHCPSTPPTPPSSPQVLASLRTVRSNFTILANVTTPTNKSVSCRQDTPSNPHPPLTTPPSAPPVLGLWPPPPPLSGRLNQPVYDHQTTPYKIVTSPDFAVCHPNGHSGLSTGPHKNVAASTL